jgi:hypothetical protein
MATERQDARPAFQFDFRLNAPTLAGDNLNRTA